MNTQQVEFSLINYISYFKSFEQLNQRAVAVVVDPIQSVKGKVVIDAFRLINPQTVMLGQVSQDACKYLKLITLQGS
jgi:hypothetical protein